ncbi:MAG: hypothetical protein AAF411_29150, partial [Myxococcota bacterium]
MDRVPMTPQGFEALKEELAKLKAEMPKISQQMPLSGGSGGLVRMGRPAHPQLAPATVTPY